MRSTSKQTARGPFAADVPEGAHAMGLVVSLVGTSAPPNANTPATSRLASRRATRPDSVPARSVEAA
jgi:hypothetical protein